MANGDDDHYFTFSVVGLNAICRTCPKGVGKKICRCVKYLKWLEKNGK